MQALVAALGHLNRALRTARFDFDGLLETPERVPIGAQQILEKEYLVPGHGQPLHGFCQRR
jgi:hypothetical protein